VLQNEYETCVNNAGEPLGNLVQKVDDIDLGYDWPQLEQTTPCCLHLSLTDVGPPCPPCLQAWSICSSGLLRVRTISSGFCHGFIFYLSLCLCFCLPLFCYSPNMHLYY